MFPFLLSTPTLHAGNSRPFLSSHDCGMHGWSMRHCLAPLSPPSKPMASTKCSYFLFPIYSGTYIPRFKYCCCLCPDDQKTLGKSSQKFSATQTTQHRVEGEVIKLNISYIRPCVNPPHGTGLSGHPREPRVSAVPPAVQRALRLHGGHHERQRGELAG